MKTRDIVLTALFTGINIVCALIAIPAVPVPFSLGLFAVFLSGALLDKKYALLSQLLYLMIGIVGLPVFARFTGGIGAVVGPTGGYLVAYPIMAFTIAFIVHLFRKKTVITYFIGMLVSLAICYLLGTAWLSIYLGKSFVAALSVAVVPFIAFDLAKIVVAVAVAMVVGKFLRKN